jgi:hypothetical protein
LRCWFLVLDKHNKSNEVERKMTEEKDGMIAKTFKNKIMTGRDRMNEN